ncbi:MAG: hypothetical protein K9G58_03415 [Bacteroidales bacterium]|nr:hypothetical protein [Bacteroidales bacterium]
MDSIFPVKQWLPVLLNARGGLCAKKKRELNLPVSEAPPSALTPNKQAHAIRERIGLSFLV